MKKEINVFIISPNDVKEERQIAKEVCEKLNQDVDSGIEVNAVLWEYHPMSYHKNAQENIDDTLDKCDIYVVILWHRLGSIVKGYEGAVTKSKQVTGTQYEIEKILSLKKEHIYFYFKREDKSFLEDELKEALYQKNLLDTFLENIDLEKGSTKHGYQEFYSNQEFRKKITNHLKIEIEKQTGMKIDSVTKRKKLNYFSLVVVLLSSIFLAWIITTNIVTNKMKDSSLRYEKKPNIYLEINGGVKDSLSQKTFDYFLNILTNSGLNITSTGNNSTLQVIIHQDVVEKIPIISEMKMYKEECTLSYILIETETKKIIYSMQNENEVVDFNHKNAQIKCFTSLYEKVAHSLIEKFNHL
jgi:hypothetical protein